MTNILRCGCSLGTKPLSSLNRVGRITSISSLLASRAVGFSQNQSYSAKCTARKMKPPPEMCLWSGKGFSIHLFLAYMSSHLCIWVTHSSWDLCRLQRQQSLDSLLSLTKQVINQTPPESFCSEVVLTLSPDMVAAKCAGISSLQLVWDLQTNHF